ncbi:MULTISPECIES: hypothetical protein [unclassified Haladaptatus]|uniref:DUF5789 family protein n=1 Tax=unclassified Haladaptatus TaxID=2622732 RepID=UPI0023E7CDB0|nr:MULTISPECIES: hypothetical protein [unclassified Haladaptatus]
MARTVKLSRVNGTLAELSYPISRTDAMAELSDVTVLLADGETKLSNVIERAPSMMYETMEDLQTDLLTYMPVRAVGEPGQSEGDA